MELTPGLDLYMLQAYVNSACQAASAMQRQVPNPSTTLQLVSNQGD